MTDIEGVIRFFNGWKNRDEKDRKILPQNTVAYNAYTKEIEYLELAIKALKQEPKWIPVSERLPEQYKEVIVTDIETSDTYVSRYTGNGYWECDNGLFKNRIIAWKPKPKPYKAESEE